VLAPGNRRILSESFRVVWIRVSAEEAVRRAACSAGTRPLLDHPDPLARARELLAAREGLYRDCADHVVDTEALRSVQSIAEAIHEYLRAGF
jgi:shikimate kinase